MKQPVPSFWPVSLPVPERNWAAYNAHARNSVKKSAKIWWGQDPATIANIMPKTGVYWAYGSGFIVNTDLYELDPLIVSNLSSITDDRRISEIEMVDVEFVGFGARDAWALPVLMHADMAVALNTSQLRLGMGTAETLEEQQMIALEVAQVYYPTIVEAWIDRQQSGGWR